jgi:tetratricopeptide (TPR) repeat protein
MTGRTGPGGRRALRSATLVTIVVLAVASAGCATHIARGDPRTQRGVPDDSLDSYIARVLAVSSAARTTSATAAAPVEAEDPSLSAALTRVAMAPTAAHLRQAGFEYRRLGINDMAYRYFTRAIDEDRKDATSFDMRARIWRDWGVPVLGYPDAYRAVALAPRSPEAANTLGTLFEAAGNPLAARVWYERAVSLSPAAGYALSNLCYLSVMRADADAVAACERAVAAAPDSTAARNNLALARAAGDDYDAARAEFTATLDAAAAHYNMGIVYMARREYAKATVEFSTALRLNPGMLHAADRAHQARVALDER